MTNSSRYGRPDFRHYLPPHLRASWARHVEDVTGDPAVEALERAVISHWHPDTPPDHLTADHARRIAADTGEDPLDVLAALIREVEVPAPAPEPVTVVSRRRVAQEAEDAALSVLRDALGYVPVGLAGEVEAAVRRALKAAFESGQTDGFVACATIHKLPID